jgi:hypothetical protein
MGVDGYVCHFEGDARLRLYEQSGWKKKMDYENPDHPTDRKGRFISNSVAELKRAQYQGDLYGYIKRRPGVLEARMLPFALAPPHLRSRVCRDLLPGHIPGADITIEVGQKNQTPQASIVSDGNGHRPPQILLRIPPDFSSPVYFPQPRIAHP